MKRLKRPSSLDRHRRCYGGRLHRLCPENRGQLSVPGTEPGRTQRTGRFRNPQRPTGVGRLSDPSASADGLPQQRAGIPCQRAGQQLLLDPAWPLGDGAGGSQHLGPTSRLAGAKQAGRRTARIAANLRCPFPGSHLRQIVNPSAGRDDHARGDPLACTNLVLATAGALPELGGKRQRRPAGPLARKGDRTGRAPRRAALATGSGRCRFLRRPQHSIARTSNSAWSGRGP